ncbi:MAG: hypothetical protein H0U77_12855 [Nocardioidaceae bacterium]|nr:hypothetical protein [Nocardioidaceae bacterium]
MRFAGDDIAGVAGGRITLAFRRWSRPRVLAGRVYRTNGGRLRIVSIQPVDPARITRPDARAAGHPRPEQVRAALRGSIDDPVFRIAFIRETGPDPRSVLAADDQLSARDLDAVVVRLDRLDRASSRGPWTRAVLASIREFPGVRAPDLAAAFGRDTQPFKIDVRKLKNLGLTHSLRVGYELSPRGRVVLAHLPPPED